MNPQVRWRPLIFSFFLVAGVYTLWRVDLPADRAAKLDSLAIILITGVYAIFTFEILIENRSMARAAKESTRIMEQSLRFSLAPSLIFSTVVTKDPSLKHIAKCKPFDNDDQRRALRELVGAGEQVELVYAVIRNIGRGSATKLSIAATFRIKDTANPNATYSLDKRALLQSLDPESAVALCIYISKVPTPDDRVDLVRADMSSSDSYRDAISEVPVSRVIGPEDNEVQRDESCVLRVG